MTLSPSHKAALTDAFGGRIRWDEPMSAWTTFRIGGPAEALVTLFDSSELSAALTLCRDRGIPWKLLGRGSNVLAADSGFFGLVIVLGDGFAYIERSDEHSDGPVTVRAGGAVGLPRLAGWCAAQGIAGLEFAAGIPGTLGGAVRMNAGAWGREFSDIITAVELVDHRGVTVLGRDALDFSYRCCDTLLHLDAPGVVTGIEVELERGEPEHVKAVMKRLQAVRRQKQPLDLPSAGSIFKNPPGTSAGRLIDGAGLKGVRIGDAQVSRKHGNFFVNRGRARAADVVALIDAVRERVEAVSGITLEPEIEFLRPLG